MLLPNKKRYEWFVAWTTGPRLIRCSVFWFAVYLTCRQG
jgi:hypothetical protein